MTVMRLSVNGELVFAGDLTEWKEGMPEAVREVLKPGVSPEPWAKAVLMTVVMMTMADSAKAGRGTGIEAWTSDGEWRMRVSEL